MKTRIFRGALLAGAVLAAMAPHAAAQTFAVIVHADNTFQADDAGTVEQLRRLYLKDQTSWPGGADAIAFAREEGTPEQDAFLSAVVGMSPSEEQAHWLRLKQIRGETEPRAVGSSRILARQIARNEGAFSVVLASEAADMEGVRVLYTFDPS